VEEEIAATERLQKKGSFDSEACRSPDTAAAASGDESKLRRGPVAQLMRVLRRLFSPVFLEAFVLTFLAEWGDRSQIATIGASEGASALDPDR
jgi:putative Ca2+/H+ antiporter (TMEM165/GDT1 family)